MAMIGMSPWAAAAGGLAGGLGQGIMTGMDLAQRRRQEEAQKQRDAMNLLITGFKHLSDDPESLKQFTQWFGQTTGMPVPPWVGGTTDPGQVMMKKYQQYIAAGATPEQANAATFGIKSTKTDKPNYVMVADPQSPGGVRFMEAPAGNIKTPAWMGPQYPVYQQQEGGGVSPLPNLSTPGRPQFLPVPKPTESETEKPLSPTEMKKFDALQERINATTDPNEAAVYKKQIEDSGGRVETITQPTTWGGLGGGGTKYIVIPPETRTVKTKKGGIGGIPDDTAELKKRIEETRKKIEELRKAQGQ